MISSGNRVRDVAEVFRQIGRDQPLELDVRSVQIWHLQLSSVPAFGEEHWLSADEKERAERYYFAKDRRRFIAGRGALRLLLAGYLGTAPGEIVFRYGRNGKPHLQGGEKLFFNVSHSRGNILLAFSRRPVGIDIEERRGGIDFLGMAREHFTSDECALLGVSGKPVAETFFRCWTRKEACVKLLGTGLCSSTTQVDTTKDRVFLPPRPGERQVTSATLTTFDFADHSTVSLAVEGGQCAAQIFQFRDPCHPCADSSSGSHIIQKSKGS